MTEPEQPTVPSEPGDATQAMPAVDGWDGEPTQAMPVADTTAMLPHLPDTDDTFGELLAGTTATAGTAGATGATTRIVGLAGRNADATVALPLGAAVTAGGIGSGRDAPPPAGGGVGNVFRRHPQAWIAAALALVFVLLGTGAVFAGIGVGSAGASTAAPRDDQPAIVPTETLDPARPLPDPLAAPTALRTCTITPQTQTAALGKLYASVIDANTGEVLFDRSATSPERTASVLKVLTAAAALEVLGPEHRIATRVLSGRTPEEVVLVGGGDATLSRTAPGTQSFYRDAPKLSDLAAQVRASVPAETTEITLTLDSTLWDPNDNWDAGWDRSEQTQGWMSEATALQVDADRDEPTANKSRRSDDPVARAGDWFKAALEAQGFTVTAVSTGAAGSDSVELAKVESQPVRVLVSQMLMPSDNTLAEMLARLTAKALGQAGTFASLQQTYTTALSSYGIPTTGMVIKDGSGLSEFNKVTPVYVAQLLAKALHRERNLGALYDGLPVSGRSGSLAGRPMGEARGAVAAKTGWIWTARSLAGTVKAADGSQLAFAFYGVGDDDVVTTNALDALAAAVYRCGLNLSNH